MSHPTFTILAAIYQLLSSTSEQELRMAAERPDISPNIRAALLALAKELPQNSSFGLKRHPERPPRRSRDTGDPAGSRSVDRIHILAFLANKDKFPDKASLARFA